MYRHCLILPLALGCTAEPVDGVYTVSQTLREDTCKAGSLHAIDEEVDVTRPQPGALKVSGWPLCSREAGSYVCTAEESFHNGDDAIFNTATLTLTWDDPEHFTGTMTSVWECEGSICAETETYNEITFPCTEQRDLVGTWVDGV